MLKFINLKKLTYTALLAAFLIGSLSTESTLAKKDDKDKKKDNPSSETEEVTIDETEGCGNQGHGNNASMSYNIRTGILTIGHFDPSNPTNGKNNGGDTQKKLIDDLVAGNTAEGGKYSIAYVPFEGESSDYSLSQADAENIILNHPDWEIKGNKNTSTVIHDCGGDYDGDGISDAVELGSNFNSPPDSDGDGIPDYADSIDDSATTAQISNLNSAAQSPNTITLTGTVRDFKDDHPDFERNEGDTSADGTKFKFGLDKGITTNSLGLDQKPIYKGGSFSTTTQANFDQWYRDVAGVNQSKDFEITLTKQDNGVYRYENTDFFPINGELFGNYRDNKNFHFTYELHTRFTYNGGEVFNFKGDDDVWVYINGKKVIDIGGVHSAIEANVSLDAVASDIGLVQGESYTLDFFFAERHTTKSNLIIETTLELESVSEEEATSFAPVMWGIDEDDGQLFTMTDYTDSTTMTNYGLLKWNDNGTIKTIGQDMEAMTIDENGDMYIALDRKLLGTGNGATLLKTNVTHVTPDGDNVVQVLGTIGIPFNASNDNVSGLSIDPVTGELVALLKNYDPDGDDENNKEDNKNDRLYVISKTDGSLVREIGEIKGNIEGKKQKSRSAEDIEHAPDGTLYVTDNSDDHTYKVNPDTGAIIEVIDDNQKGGLDAEKVKFEALGWDFYNNRLIGFDDQDEALAQLTLEDGKNYEYYDTTSLGLTDVEGVDFVPTLDGKPINPPPKPLINLPPNPDGDPPICQEDCEDDEPEPTCTEDCDTEEEDSDADKNGILDADEFARDGGDKTADLDEDGVPNYKDLDDDGDNIPDVVELHSVSELTGAETHLLANPKLALSITLDEGELESYTLPKPIDREKPLVHSASADINDDVDVAIDSDGDGTPDYHDIDSDDDTIKDIHEAGDSNLQTPVAQSDSDTTPDYLDEDSDNDTISDAIEAGDVDLNTPPINSDTPDEEGAVPDLLPDFIDLDSDNDTISDEEEADISEEYPTPIDSDGDEIPNYRDIDSDADFISDKDEAGDDDITTPATNTDGDLEGGDELADYLDDDSDADGYLDSEEAGDDDLTTPPDNSDAQDRNDLGFPSYNDDIPDFQDLDSDDNGILDIDEVNGSSFDNDGIDNYKDLDDDDDGIADVIEIGADPNSPTNSDGVTSDGYDYQDTNSEDDRLTDVEEGVSATDGEGITTITITAPIGDSSATVNLKNGGEGTITGSDDNTINITSDEDGYGMVNITGTAKGFDYQEGTVAD